MKMNKRFGQRLKICSNLFLLEFTLKNFFIQSVIRQQYKTLEIK